MSETKDYNVKENLSDILSSIPDLQNLNRKERGQISNLFQQYTQMEKLFHFVAHPGLTPVFQNGEKVEETDVDSLENLMINFFDSEVPGTVFATHKRDKGVNQIERVLESWKYVSCYLGGSDSLIGKWELPNRNAAVMTFVFKEELKSVKNLKAFNIEEVSTLKVLPEWNFVRRNILGISELNTLREQVLINLGPEGALVAAIGESYSSLSQPSFYAGKGTQEFYTKRHVMVPEQISNNFLHAIIIEEEIDLYLSPYFDRKINGKFLGAFVNTREEYAYKFKTQIEEERALKEEIKNTFKS